MGGVLGLLAEPLIDTLVGTTWRAVSLIYLIGLAAPVVVLALLPETARRELDELSPERYTGRPRHQIRLYRSKAVKP